MTTLTERIPPVRRWQMMAALLALIAVASIVALFVVRGRPPAPPPPAPVVVDPHAGHRQQSAAPDPHAAHRAADSYAAHAVEGRAPIRFAPEKLSRLGVVVVTAERASVSQPLRAVATVALDETRVSHVHPRVAGWIEKLYVPTTGQPVRAGQALAEIFSQQLLASQNEYLTLKRAGSAPLLQSARERLKVLGMTGGEIDRLDQSGKAMRTVTLVAPRGGIVLHRGIVAGTAVDPSTELLTVADISRVWVYAELPQSAIGNVRAGTAAELSFPSKRRRTIEAKVAFVSPTLTERTRTQRIRFALENRDRALKPGMFGEAVFRIPERNVLVVPRDAVVDTGGAQHVFVATGPGAFEPRRVLTGARLDERIEIVEGLDEKTPVVSSGVFLIDSESRLRASGGGAGHAGH